MNTLPRMLLRSIVLFVLLPRPVPATPLDSSHFLAPPPPSSTSFLLYVNDHAPFGYVPTESLDFSTPVLNLMRTTSRPSESLQAIYDTHPDAPQARVGATISVDLSTASAARFAQNDNVLILNRGIDEVSIEEVSTVPEPSTGLACFLLLLWTLACSNSARKARRR